LPKKVRSHLLIDGLPVIELDYGQTHLRMAAARRGIDLGSGDVYRERAGWTRGEIKIAVNVSLNAPTRRSAIGRVALELGGTIGCYQRASLLVDAIKKWFPEIAGDLHTGAGLHLMRVDSDIAERVMLRLLNCGIIALPIHDSFVVAAKNAGILREEMASAWRAQLGTNPVIG
jgi:hypothetical protein